MGSSRSEHKDDTQFREELRELEVEEPIDDD
jgi:hypothetical protein